MLFISWTSPNCDIGKDLSICTSNLSNILNFFRLKKLQKLLHAVLNLDQSTIAEIRGYNNPPKGVHQVMRATLLVLGYWEEDTSVSMTVSLAPRLLNFFHAQLI